MIESRPDWCISRQRTWGVPIPLFVHKVSGELHPRTQELIEAAAARVEQGGIDAWFALEPRELLGADAAQYDKVTDVMDVWADSGLSFECVGAERPEVAAPVELYLEGSDQHRGWFHSSLLMSEALYERAPYRGVLTHGFTVDEKGRKMSKSFGNVIAPQKVMSTLGADVLRLWVSATDYANEIAVSDEILRRMADSYRRMRNTLRFLLGNLHGFDPARHQLPAGELLALDRWALARARALQAEVLEAYRSYSFHLIYQKVHNFCSVDLGGFYLDVIKDRMYTLPADGAARRSAQTAMFHIAESMVRWLAPILSFTAEEVWGYLPGERARVGIPRDLACAAAAARRDDRLGGADGTAQRRAARAGEAARRAAHRRAARCAGGRVLRTRRGRAFRSARRGAALPADHLARAGASGRRASGRGGGGQHRQRRRVDRGAAHRRSQVRALLASPARRRRRRAPSAAVRALRQQRRRARRSQEIRMSDVGNGSTPLTAASAAAAPPAVPAAASGWRWLPLAAAVIVADQAVKAWIVHHFVLFERVHVLDVLDFILTYNTGAAFSFLADAPGWQRWLFVLLALGVSTALLVWMRRLRASVQGLLACGLALIVGGALGNMIDRLARGRVVDFIHVHAGSAYFPAFNLADSAITVGAAVLLFDAWRESRATATEAHLMQVLLANPRGFCAGVDRAIDIVERALQLFGAPVYVRHEVVHNTHVVERLRALGAIFVDELAEVPAGSTVIFSAHGVSNAVEEQARSRGLTVFDATCPLVTKVHMEVQRYAREGRDVILIGHAGHPEVDRHHGALRCFPRRAHPSGAEHRRRRRARGARSRASSPSLRRRRCRWTTPRKSSPRCVRASRSWPRRGARTSAMRRRTARTQ